MFFQGLEAKTLSFPVPSACFVEKQKTKKNPQPCFCHGDLTNTQLKSDFQIQYLRFVVNREGPKPSLLESPVFWLKCLLWFIKLSILYLTVLSFRAEAVKKTP